MRALVREEPRERGGGGQPPAGLPRFAQQLLRLADDALSRSQPAEREQHLWLAWIDAPRGAQQPIGAPEIARAGEAHRRADERAPIPVDSACCNP